MLIKPLLEADRFVTGLVSEGTVDTSLAGNAANDGLNQAKDTQARRLRRLRRQSRLASSNLGGWKIRMW